ncbi:MAG: UDP-glucose/GDP-mannose dehydrogenase family protein [Actinobacteria bacterium]|nr:UDP-glucose/GDP-mannose dehydrogenase family protein [Actinomycetota bacterium]
MPHDERVTPHLVDDRLRRPERIVVVGAGYIGLPTAAGFADVGYDVVCVDANVEKLGRLASGQVELHEPNLQELVRTGLRTRRLSFSGDLVAAVSTASIVFVCVPTPQGDDGAADLSFVESVVHTAAAALRPGAIVVTRSTVPAGTAARLAGIIGRRDVHVASNPEFLREGSAVRDFFNPDRILIGATEPAVRRRLAELYAVFGAPVIVTDIITAELTKHAANAFLATRLSFVNSMANICEAAGADVHEMMRVVGLDPRIGSRFMSAGPGWGGSCLPKDTRALAYLARQLGEPFAQLESTVESNERQFDRVVRRLAEQFDGSIAGRRIAVWGLAFKAGTNDLRDSPAVAVCRRLLAVGAEVCAHDPAVSAAAAESIGVGYADTSIGACFGADALVVLTEWPEYADAEVLKVAAAMSGRVVFDTRNVLSVATWISAGFVVLSVGRGSPDPITTSSAANAA